MRVMVIVKANKDSEAGSLPNEKVLADMQKFNEELVKAGVIRRGAPSELKGQARQVHWGQADCNRRAVHRDQGTDRGVLAVAGKVDGGGDRVARALAIWSRCRRDG